ncbi:MAG: DUF4062 domain-containing protein [Nitrospiraceae bacterium]|nr:MAG: DUF4062 domain-containing protein [Nitrospiraceae bacterium]
MIGCSFTGTCCRAVGLKVDDHFPDVRKMIPMPKGAEMKLKTQKNNGLLANDTNMMQKVFISSVITDFEEYRKAAGKAVEIMGDRPVMSEDFGARPYSPEKVCVTEVETSDIYLVLLGEKYGFVYCR